MLQKLKTLFRLYPAPEPGHTRSISPRLGWLGLLGLLGFLGFFTWPRTGDWFPLVFFAFFGFFGFFYEGRMSGVLMDERYVQNTLRAQAAAFRTALLLITLALIAAVNLVKEPEAAFLLLVSAVSLGWGLAMFLQEYLLYRYDQEE